MHHTSCITHATHATHAAQANYGAMQSALEVITRVMPHGASLLELYAGE
jgi:hypothetical protein